MAIITLLTDSGMADGYVGMMHGVILRINPRVSVVDISHDVSPQDVRAAAFVLSMTYPYFPNDAIHVVVVDPGVGSARRPIAMRTEHGTFVAPDNGVLTYVLARESVLEVIRLTEPRYWLPSLSNTFHGRDLFAPVAAHISLGVRLGQLGPPIDDPVRLQLAKPSLGEDGSIRGEVQHVDRFGNLITNMPGEMLPTGPVNVRVGERDVAGPVSSYAHVEDGELLAIVDASGNLEIPVRNGSAAARLQTGRGAVVTVTPEELKTSPPSPG